MKPTRSTKVLIAGVGGQGIVYLSNILTEAALSAGIPVGVSEIHGLSQRGGVVTSGLTFGKNGYGFIEEAGADFLIGLEPMEAMRCLNYMHKGSRVVIDNNPILPYAVNAGLAGYPDIHSWVEFLRQSVEEVILLDAETKKTDPLLRNIFVLAKAVSLKEFPVASHDVEAAMNSLVVPVHLNKTLSTFKSGLKL